MAYTAEEKLRIAEILVAYQISRSLINRFLSGRVTKAENKLMVAMVRAGGRMVAAGAMRAPGTVAGLAGGAARAAGFIAMRHPVLTGAAIVYVAYKEREQIRDLLAQGYDIVSDVVSVPSVGMPDPAIPTFRPGPAAFPMPGLLGAPRPKRKTSRANTAVKQAMKWLKGGGPSTTGAVRGRLPKNAFKIATKAAGMANPKTPSKPGKGKSIMNKIARRLKKWW